MAVTIVVLFWMLLVIRWWFREYKDDGYIDHNDYIIDDFYTHSKGIDDV